MKREDETQTEYAIRLIREDGAAQERERIARTVERALCDVSEDESKFMQYRKYFADLIRSGANF